MSNFISAERDALKKERDELRADNNVHVLKIIELQAELERANKELEERRMATPEMNALHMLQSEAAEWKRKFEECATKYAACADQYSNLADLLIAERAKAYERALEFYADKSHWKSVTIEDTNRRFCIFTGADLEYFQEENQNSYCGKRARAALAKWGKGDGE